MPNTLQDNIRFLVGVGEKRAAAFLKSGVRTVCDLLSFYPRSYEDWQNASLINEAAPDAYTAVKARIVSKSPDVKSASGRLVSKILATDGVSAFSVIFFNNPYATKNLRAGEEYIFYGKIKENGFKEKQMLSPKYESAEKGGYIHPVYPQSRELNSRYIAKTVKTALENYSSFLDETLPEEQIKKYRLMSYKDAARAIHFPKNAEELKGARRRLVYEELLILQLGILSGRNKERDKNAFAIQKDYTDEFILSLPFKLTAAQKKAIKECAADMRKNTPMRRLLQGDVGSGKTAVAAALIYNAVKNGYQCALMAPTEVLAVQHRKTFAEFFKDKGINAVLLTGGMTEKNKRLIKKEIADGNAQLVIGTHAVISDSARFKNLAFAATDEQHRFGVNQRAALRKKGENPHILVMSATPIPRTLSLIIYGDLDISVLDEKPAGRKDVKTYLVGSIYHERIYAFIRKQVFLGRQCYIVCPKVEESPESLGGRKSAEEYADLLSTSVFSDLRTAVLHGKMNRKRKDETTRAFYNGEIDILICTVVIEVGIDVPNATVMVIENAESFGLSQLHQLRGRVGRSGATSYCILVSDAKNAETEKRFKIMCKTNDGFKIAEEDLKIRGPGDFFGSRQSGLPDLKIASLITDTKILYASQAEAKRIVADDPFLEKKENELMRKNILNLFADIS